MNNDAEVLNGLLNKIGVKGFSFFCTEYYLTIKIPRTDDAFNHYYLDYCLFGAWINLNELFTFNSLHNTWSIDQIINSILETHNVNNNLGYRVDYLGINAAGLDFLRCLKVSESLEELEIKLSIYGY